MQKTSNPSNIKPKIILMAILTAYAVPQIAYAEDNSNAVDLGKIEVIGTTPLAGVGLPIEQIPSNVQVVKGKELQQQNSLSIADFMNNNLLGVSVNETQNNPYQPDILFRGFTASPLLGTPQGLSVFQDGVRVNEPFGDAVNWDLIPVNAIAGMNLMPGSNPVFGLNTLGGALSVQTKNGRTHQGGGIETSFGSWSRKTVAAEFGGVSTDNSIDYFLAGNYFDEDGWRDHSPTEVKQIFGKLGWQNEASRLELSYTGADNDMIGNGLIQKELMEDFGRETINTKPDQTKNTLSFLNLNGSHWLNDDVQLSANTYYRKSKRKTLNGDVNDDYVLGVDVADNDINCIANTGGDADEWCSGALNRSNTDQNGYGFNAQLAFNQPLLEKQNQLIVGLGYDYSRVKFNQSSEFGIVNASRGVDGVDVENDETEVDLLGKTRSWGIFATDTLSLTDQWHLTLSGRYNHIKVKNTDKISPKGTFEDVDGDPLTPDEDVSLSGNHSFSRLNPAIGLSFTPTKDLSVYGSYNEGMRAPTSMELGCANPNVPCKLPNAMAGDPPLDEVVSKTFELGARGNLTSDVKWSAAVYHTDNHDDIHFISTNATNGMGYFDNVGKTRRMGLDAGLSGAFGSFSWNAGYSYLKATYESDLELTNSLNSTSDGNAIQVNKGDRLANLPEHSLKLRLQLQATPNWSIGTNINTFSDVYIRGNENNKHRANDGDADHVQDSGKIGGYTVVNLDTRYKFGDSGWQVFAKAINIFDKEYATGGMLGENWIEDGVFAGDDEPSKMLMPGAPRAGWIGVRYDFGGKK
ncbi:MAG TPA: TonB-dependent receptor [Methylotenera sp.]|jgi:outer membrane receptor protein involved in Fe transport|nr:TonB-dependent receptor [Methylotenera sp.]HPH08433.1 TonB-dependent receptor [Methylotenera sp.]HPM48246.1 TonB-dependent receptor [Methylotenera sp.]